MSAPKRFLDIEFPLPFFDIEEERGDSPTGFQVVAGHLKEAFLERADDGAYLLRSFATDRVLSIRAVEIRDGGLIKVLGDDGKEKMIRIRPFAFPP